MNYLDQDKKGGVHLEGTQLFMGLSNLHWLRH